MKIMKLVSLALLAATTASVLGGCVVETRPWRPHYYHHPVVIVR